jgi:hypothetical protein
MAWAKAHSKIFFAASSKHEDGDADFRQNDRMNILPIPGKLLPYNVIPADALIFTHFLLCIKFRAQVCSDDTIARMRNLKIQHYVSVQRHFG